MEQENSEIGLTSTYKFWRTNSKNKAKIGSDIYE